MTYNGWTNWDTWNVALIWDNDEILYKRKLEWAKNLSKKIKKGTFNKIESKKIAKYFISEARKVDKDIVAKEVNKAEIVNSVLEMAEGHDLITRAEYEKSLLKI